MRISRGFDAPNLIFYTRTDINPSFADFDSKTNFANHVHNEYELYFFLQGDVDYFVGNSFYHLSENDLLIIPPAVFHYPKLLSDVPYQRIYINFTKAHLTDALQAKLDDLQVYYKIPADSNIHDLYKNATLALERYEKQDAQSCLIHYLNLILTEITYLDKITSYATPKYIHPLLGEILTFIDNNLNLPLSLDIIARELSISPTWLTHFFKKQMNISVMQYITHKKILLAQQSIKNGTSPTIVAEKFGFENYTTFYNQYKKIVGIAPNASKPRGG